jgi:hypothetical protein
MQPGSDEQTQAALLLSQTSTHEPQQSPVLARHLAGCRECQAFRRHIFAQLHPIAPPQVGHEACQADLAAYVDRLLDAGSLAAARESPHVWWHLWECADCAAIFVQTAALARAERAGALPPLPITPPPARRRVIGRLAVTPQVAVHLLQSRALLGAAYGAGGEVVLDEGEDEGHSFQLSLRRSAGESWEILVSVAPPVTGGAVVRVGAATFRAPFDRDGVATISAVPAELLRGGQSSILVTIEVEP